MKRIFPLVLFLLLLTACSPANRAPTPAAEAAPLSRVTADAPTAPPRKLTVVLVDCSASLSIREEAGAALSFSGTSEHYASTYDQETETMTITQTDPAWVDGAALTIPPEVYGTIRIEAKDSAFSLFPTASGYEVKADDCALSMTFLPGYTGTVYTNLTDCSVSYLLSKNLTDYSLRFDAEDCAVSAPDGWNDTDAPSFTLTRGTAAAKLDLRNYNCAVKVSETSEAFSSRYQSATPRGMMIQDSTLELYLGDPNGYGPNWTVRNWKQVLKDAKANAIPNTVTTIKTISADGITALRINADLCGVVLEPSQSGSFELSYVGVEIPADIAVTAETVDGVLIVTAEGTDGVPRYISAAADARVNCVRLGVPREQLTSLLLDNGRAVIASKGLALPAVTGSAGGGLVVLDTETVSAPITLSARNGSAVVRADSVTAAIALDTHNGSASVTAAAISGAASLTATNGSVDLKAETVTGKVTLTATNGSVEADLDRVADAAIKADNGSVEARLGTITGAVTCGVRNGAMEVALARRPADLTFHVTGGWEHRSASDWTKDWYDEEELPSGLPEGWYDGLVLGSGKPTLTLSCASNGYLSLTVPEK